MKNILTTLSIAGSLMALAAPASAQFAKPEDAVKYRQGALTLMGAHLGRLGAMANGRVPYDAKAAAENAEVLATVAKLPWAAFGPGTDKVQGSKAKPEIWAEQAKFKDHADKMMAETVKLAAAAKAGNLDALKAAFGPTAGSCKSCHDAYRAQ